MARGRTGIRSHDFAHCFLLFGFGWLSSICMFAVVKEYPHRSGVLWVLAMVFHGRWVVLCDTGLTVYTRFSCI
jgi:hypothetical protein